MRGTVKIAAWRPIRFGRAAAVALLASAAGCAGGGARTALDGVASAPALPDSLATMQAGNEGAVITTGEPSTSASAAELTRWSAAAHGAGRHAEAIEILSQWLVARSTRDADEGTVRAALAVHHEALGEVAEAAAALAPCAGDEPAVARVRTWLNLRGDGFGEALADAKRAADFAPASAADRNNYGVALLYAGRPAEAREAFLAARELDPALPGALYNLAIVESVYFFDDHAARRWLADYRRLSSDDPDGLFESLGGASVAASGQSPDDTDGELSAVSRKALP